MMQKYTYRKQAFTLIELLTVIAIIGILAAILIPTVGVVKEKATIATSKARIMQYITAIERFKGDYNYYPFTDELEGTESSELDLSSEAKSRVFVETLSGRKIDDPTTRSSDNGGNRRYIEYYTFTDDEISEGETVTANTVVDGFGNNKIVFVFDKDGDGEVKVPDPEGSETSKIDIRASVTAYVEENDTIGAPAYYMYE